MAASQPMISTDILNEEFTCAICSELICQFVSLRCKHSFCQLCVEQWFEKKGSRSCPTCRADHPGEIHQVLAFDSVIEKLVNTLTPIDRMVYQARQAQAKQAEAKGVARQATIAAQQAEQQAQQAQPAQAQAHRAQQTPDYAGYLAQHKVYADYQQAQGNSQRHLHKITFGRRR